MICLFLTDNVSETSPVATPIANVRPPEHTGPVMAIDNGVIKIMVSNLVCPACWKLRKIQS